MLYSEYINLATKRTETVPGGRLRISYKRKPNVLTSERVEAFLSEFIESSEDVFNTNPDKAEELRQLCQSSSFVDMLMPILHQRLSSQANSTDDHLARLCTWVCRTKSLSRLLSAHTYLPVGLPRLLDGPLLSAAVREVFARLFARPATPTTSVVAGANATAEGADKQQEQKHTGGDQQRQENAPPGHTGGNEEAFETTVVGLVRDGVAAGWKDWKRLWVDEWTAQNRLLAASIYEATSSGSPITTLTKCAEEVNRWQAILAKIFPREWQESFKSVQQTILVGSKISELIKKSFLVDFIKPDIKDQSLVAGLRLLHDSLGSSGTEYSVFAEHYFDCVNRIIRTILANSDSGDSKAKEPGAEQEQGPVVDKPTEELITKEYESIYEYYSLQMDLIRKAFADSYVCKTELARAIDKVNLADLNRAADQLSRYFANRLSEIETEVSDLKNVLPLFQQLSAKDLFIRLYNQRLVRRLASDKTTGLAREKEMAEQLKQHAGELFIPPTEGILSQFEKNQTALREFETYIKVKHPQSPAVEALKVSIIPSHTWPFTQFVEVEEYLTGDLKTMAQQFHEYYTGKESAHILSFQFEASSCDVWFRPTQGNYLLEGLSLLQAMIVLELNKAGTLTFGEIKQRFSKVVPHIGSHLIPLCKPSPKQVLIKTPNTASFKDTDTFSVKLDFTSKKKKIAFHTLIKKELKEDLEATRERVFQERLYSIESHIVRIMKGAKKLQHAKLVKQALDALKLPLTHKDIAKCIDGLIARDFLERDDDDPQVYKYLA